MRHTGTGCAWRRPAAISTSRQSAPVKSWGRRESRRGESRVYMYMGKSTGGKVGVRRMAMRVSLVSNGRENIEKRGEVWEREAWEREAWEREAWERVARLSIQSPVGPLAPVGKPGTVLHSFGALIPHQQLARLPTQHRRRRLLPRQNKERALSTTCDSQRVV